jgi:RNA polymerase sigma-70 factor (ECF subfamily)
VTSDGELVRQTLAGQMAAYEQLVRRWSARVLAFCHARTGNAHAAEDLAQETLLRGLRVLPSLEDPDRFGCWLCGIAHRVCLDWRKSKERTQVSLGSLPHADGSEGDGLLATDKDPTQHAAEQADDVRRLMAEVEALPETYREVLMLYYYDDLTYQDLAELLGVSFATVNARLTKAKAMLRCRLSQCGRP